MFRNEMFRDKPQFRQWNLHHQKQQQQQSAAVAVLQLWRKLLLQGKLALGCSLMLGLRSHAESLSKARGSPEQCCDRLWILRFVSAAAETKRRRMLLLLLLFLVAAAA